MAWDYGLQGFGQGSIERFDPVSTLPVSMAGHDPCMKRSPSAMLAAQENNDKIAQSVALPARLLDRIAPRKCDGVAMVRRPAESRGGGSREDAEQASVRSRGEFRGDDDRVLDSVALPP